MAEGTLHYKEHYCSSNADWLVFIHGAGGSSATRYKQVKTLKNYFNLILIDLRGHGRSNSYRDKTTIDNYTFDLIVNDVLKVLEEKHIDHAHFIAMSLGTIIVRHLAKIKPQMVQSMLLAGAVVHLSAFANLLAILGDFFKNTIPYLWLYKFFALIIMPHHSQKEARKLFISEARNLNKAEFKRWFLLTREVNGVMHRLSEHEPQSPTLYIMGDKDRFFLKSVERNIKKYSSCSTVSVIADCGHVCNIEKPDEFNQIVIDFIHGHA